MDSTMAQTEAAMSRVMKIPRGIEEMQRAGLVRWALKEPNEFDQRFCESAVSPYPVVGFDVRGIALIECETVAEAVCVPNVAIVRIRDFSLGYFPNPERGGTYKFQRIAVKIFKVEEK
jgi:hypothetical protein